MTKKVMLLSVKIALSICVISNIFAMELVGEKGTKKELKVEYSIGIYDDSINGAARIEKIFEKSVFVVVSKKRGGEFYSCMYVRGTSGLPHKSEDILYPEIVETLKEKVLEQEQKAELEEKIGLENKVLPGKQLDCLEKKNN
jgi:hypothetical protein